MPEDALPISARVAIPLHEIELSAIRAGGPGGPGAPAGADPQRRRHP
ncbi:hypothetical protein [Sulfurivermis fontis]